MWFGGWKFEACCSSDLEKDKTMDGWVLPLPGRADKDTCSSLDYLLGNKDISCVIPTFLCRYTFYIIFKMGG